MSTFTSARTRMRLFASAGLCVAAVFAFAGCSVDDDALNGPTSSAKTEKPDVEVLDMDADLAAQVPESDRGRKLVYATSENPPYFSVQSDGSYEGLAVDLAKQFSSILDIDITFQTTTLDAAIPGIQSGRIDISGPAGDFVERQELVDFTDLARSNVTLLVRDDSGFVPSSDTDLCGTKLGIKKGAGTQTVLDNVSAKCLQESKQAVNISTYNDLSQGNLAVRSGRIDAVVAPTAPNSIAAAQPESGFSVITIDDMQSLPAATATYGLETKKDSGLAEALSGALQLMHDEGAYEALFEKWQIPASMIDKDALIVNGSTQVQNG